MKNIEIENSKQKIGFFGPMKPFNSDKTFFEKRSNGGLKATIHHSPMKGVSVKHLRWWFEHIDENCEETIYVGDGGSFISKISKKNIYENLYSQANNMFGLIKIALKDKNFYLAEELSPNYLSGEDHWQKS